MKTIAELIADDIVAAASEVQTLAGYDNDASVDRATAPVPTVIKDRQIIVAMGESEPLEGEEAATLVPLMHDGYRQAFEITLSALVPEGSDYTADEYLLRLEFDLIRKLRQDYTRGGYAQNQFFGKSEAGALPNGTPGRRFKLTVLYHTVLNDPYRQ